MARNESNSLPRCIIALRLMGIYLQRSGDGTALQHTRSSQVNPPGGVSSHCHPSLSSSPGTSTKAATDYSNSWKNGLLPKVVWHIALNTLYLCGCIYVISIRDYSVTNFSGIIMNLWYLVPTTMILLSILTCAFNQRSFSRLFDTMAKIPRIESKHGRFISSFDSALLLCMIVSRFFVLYEEVNEIMGLSNDKKPPTYAIITTVSYFLFWLVFLTFIVSFNFLVSLLTRYFKQTSSVLDDQSTTSDKPEECAANTMLMEDIDRSSRASELSTTELLKQTEKTLLLIDRGILQITDVFSLVLIFLTVVFMCDLVFGLYLVASALQRGDFNVSIPLAYAVVAFCFLLLIHNPADSLSDAEEEFILKLREFIHCHENGTPFTTTGLHIALQRPRRLTLYNFGNIGRSSFINTLAFMLSYVVVTIQFSGTSTPKEAT